MTTPMSLQITNFHLYLIQLWWQFFPDLCLRRRSLCSNLRSIYPEKLHRATLRVINEPQKPLQKTVLALINVFSLLDNCLSVWLVLLYMQEDKVLFCYWILLFLLSYIQCSGMLLVELVESSSVFKEKQKDDEGTWQRNLVRTKRDKVFRRRLLENERFFSYV